MEIGLLDWYNDEKGYGVMITPENEDVFIHISNWKDTNELMILNNLPILFDKGLQRKKTTALKCVYFDAKNEEHWEKLSSLKDAQYSIRVNGKLKNLLDLILLKGDLKINYTLLRTFCRDFFNNLSTQDLLSHELVLYRVYHKTLDPQLKNFLVEMISSRVMHLEDSEIIEFWKKDIISSFSPTQEVFTNAFSELTISDLKRIDDVETKNLILLRKLEYLRQDFTTSDFLEFQQLLTLVEVETLKIKIIDDLNILAEKYYLDYVNIEITELIKRPRTRCSDIKGFIGELPSFLSDAIVEKILIITKNRITEYCSFRNIVECWEEDFIEDVESLLTSRLEDQSNDDLTYLLRSEKCNEGIRTTILDKFLTDQSFEIVLNEARSFSAELFTHYDSIVFERATKEQYFGLWKQGIASITPKNYLFKYLNHQEERFDELKYWLSDVFLSKEEASALLIEIIKAPIIDDRYSFYRVFNAVKTLIDIEPNCQELIKPIESDFVALILWHLKEREFFDFEILKGKFIYFKPDDQVYIFKRLFYLKHKGKIDFDLNKLDEIVRADLDLHLTNEKLNDDFVLDISTHIIIEGMKAFEKTGSFVFESDLILKDLRKNSKRKFKIDQYFDYCKGRQEAVWDWNTEGEISKVYVGGLFHYAISFEMYKESRHWNPKRGEFYTRSLNPKFEEIKADVKMLPMVKWNANAKYWGVPGIYTAAINSFAKQHKFFIQLVDKKNRDNNLHLVNMKRTVVPDGITFCEGRKANKQHYLLQKEFWYCAGQDCFQNCIEDHLSDKGKPDNGKDIWEDYTLLDMLKILGINVDEHNGFDLIENGHYHKFLGHINAFNRLLEHLYCKECGNLLYPVKSSHFALYRDVKFHCIEEGCSQWHKEIYLNHCLYGECKTIIDSRISQRCEHGLYICPNCGTCCSEEFFKRRLDSLTKNGGHIHPELVENVKQKNGHLEKREYFCYKCAGKMKETKKDTFYCSNCNVTYELDKFKWLSKKWKKAAI